MYDLVVLGGGPGGRSAARAAARIGARVALIDKATSPLACAHSSSVASKALLAAARLVHELRGAGRHGIRVADPEIDFAAVMSQVRAVAAEAAGSLTDEVLRARGVAVYRGVPAFEAYDTVVIDGQTRVLGQRFVIATGSRPALPAIPGLAEAGAVDELSVWTLTTLPAELVILGAEARGLEFAQALARLGSKVTVLADYTALLPHEDPEVSARVLGLLEADGITVRTGVTVAGVTVRDGRKVCTVREKTGGGTSEVAAAQILVAAGRLANLEGLNLDAVGVHADAAHGIEVDEHLQTRSSRIYAIGDVLGGPALAHAAERQAAVVVQNAVLRIPKKFDASALPRVTFLDPEVACAGLREADARAQHPEVQVLSVPLAEVDRARIEGRTDGFAKVVAMPGGKVLGAAIVAPEAALVLQELVLAMESGLGLQAIAETAHAYPTYAALVQRIAGEFVAQRAESSILHRAIRWFHGYQPRTDANGADAAAGVTAGAQAAAGNHGNGHGH
jgi:pyruvate/2-oxoglutarate dehydrogenase complex dihydrolipoamide dehydrogenase (E3) component